MKREKDEADREPKVSIFSLVKGRVRLELFQCHCFLHFKHMTKNVGPNV